jgi:hypothetical protein
MQSNNDSFNAKIDLVGTLDAVLIRKDGTHRDYGQLSGPNNYRLIGRPVQWWRSLWNALRRNKIIPATMGLAAFMAIYGVVDKPELMIALFKDPRVQSIFMGTTAGLVVTGGVNFLATDMASGQASPRISAMNFHDSGVGTVAATSTDSGLGTQAGPATRATGAQSNPATNQYRSIGTIAYVSSLAITEWGLFSANTAGTMWDRRVFTVINVVSGDSVQFTYSLTLNAGGS